MNCYDEARNLLDLTEFHFLLTITTTTATMNEQLISTVLAISLMQKRELFVPSYSKFR